jgi:hypothetical protein
MKSAAKRDNYCELQDILSSNNLNANGGFGYSWSHVRLRVDIHNNHINVYIVYMYHVDTWAIAFEQSNAALRTLTVSIYCALADRLYRFLSLKQYLCNTTSDERDCPLNLSISLSGEKENNYDS